MCRRLLIGLVAAVVMPASATADEFKPALLDIDETEPGWYALTWKVPLKNGRPLRIAPRLPANIERLGPTSARVMPGAIVEQSIWRATSGSLVGGTIEIEGLSALPLDVILQIDMADGSEHSSILRPASPSYVVPERASKWAIAGEYWKIGTIHILEGYDHLLFVLALMLIITNIWMLVKTITAFTVAHSISLALATVGIVNMPGAPTEAVIALSILFLAVEVVHSREGRITLTERFPWIVALSFGLAHGLGFAGALAEVGLPQQDIPLALLMFNVGVETGQLMFVGVVMLVITVIRKAPVKWPANSWRLVTYAIGSIAAFWTVQRVSSFL